MTTPVLGVIGGMGPEATADFYRKVIAATPARRDQDHLPVIIWGDPRTPDRSASLDGSGDDPAPYLIDAAQKLVSIGATVLAMPCNTAHAFLEQIRANVGVPIIDMIESAVKAVPLDQKTSFSVGILATTGTISASLYQVRCERRGLSPIVPRADEQVTLVAPAISAIKGNRDLDLARRLLREAATSLIARGATTLIAGCTEIPLAITQIDVAVPLVDPAQALADDVVQHVMSTHAAKPRLS